VDRLLIFWYSRISYRLSGCRISKNYGFCSKRKKEKALLHILHSSCITHSFGKKSQVTRHYLSCYTNQHPPPHCLFPRVAPTLHTLKCQFAYGTVEFMAGHVNLSPFLELTRMLYQILLNGSFASYIHGYYK
jgi:hypothetical protein